MPERRDVDRRQLATAAGGAGLIAGAPYASSLEQKVVDRRKAKVQAKIDAHQAAAPVRPRAAIPGARVSPKKKAAYSAAAKTHTGEVNALLSQRNGIRRVLTNKQSALWGGALAVGGPMVWHGTRKQFSKAVRRRDADAAMAGGAAGFLGYQGAAMAAKPIEQRAERKISSDDSLTARVNQHKKAHGVKEIVAGDKKLLPYFRSYPKDLPGGRMRRVIAHTHAGKSGYAATAAVTGAAALAAGRASQKSRVSKMSQTEINRRKKLQAASSITTGTLGLGSLAAFGASAAAKKPGRFKAVPLLRHVTHEGAKNTSIGLSATSGGIGGVSAYNFAAYTRAEGRQRKNQAAKSGQINKSAFGIVH